MRVLSNWMVNRYYPRILNVHPGDATKGYTGDYWKPSAQALLAGEETIRSTVFLVDQGFDTGPVLLQSSPVNIEDTLRSKDLLNELEYVMGIANKEKLRTLDAFLEEEKGPPAETLEHICRNLQEELKVKGDWIIYPIAVELISQGRVSIDGETLYIDDWALPPYGWRVDQSIQNQMQLD